MTTTQNGGCLRAINLSIAVKIDKSVFENCRSGYFGGAIYAENFITLTNSVIANSSAISGGGIAA